uniref:Uncharacterized protein n=1 Tax=Cannabis sativa TaxID=3483 RepID=A0A803Q9Z2_CANSA
MKRRLVRDHEKEKHKQNRNSPWRSTGSMKRILFGERYKEGNSAARKAMNREEKKKRNNHQEELDLKDQIFKLVFIVYVP